MTVEPLRMFDIPADPVIPGESYGVRLTRRNKELIAAGIHPATRLPLLAGDEVCGSCVHHVVAFAGGKGSVHKCVKHRLGMSHSEASDIRVSWPACTAWVLAPSEHPDGAVPSVP